jgi:hypothetical protein
MFPNRATQFRPGLSGNPHGRPKGTLTAMLRAFLDEEDPRTKKTYGERVVKALVNGAIKGKPVATRQLWDRVEGKVPIAVVGEVKSMRAVHQYKDPDDGDDSGDNGRAIAPVQVNVARQQVDVAGST